MKDDFAVSISTHKSLWFPNLPDNGFSITSEIDSAYNCIAWAAGDTKRWWQPSDIPYSYWPDSVPNEETVDAYVAAFETCGYVKCDSQEIEQGFEKIAIFSNNDGPQHAARQLADGNWTSKLGKFEDVTHITLESLFCKEYGSLLLFMKRPVPSVAFDY